uniref:Transaldolase n=1 Tax=Cyanothece sp. (strain PCC 7425 / ATCC 29141) TaxID=395961 RepID=B8HKG8_CYAP4
MPCSALNLQTPGVRLYLDTADPKQWSSWFSTGLFYGVTSNPLLLERSQVACRVEQLRELAEYAFQLGAREVQLQTWGGRVSNLVATGKTLAAIDDRVVVKVPVTRTGTEAAAELIAAGIRVTLTGVYAIHQVLIAAALGAEYAAPYLGRMNDLGGNGRANLIAMQKVLTSLNSPLRLLVASIRELEDIVVLSQEGLNTFTFSPAIAAAFFDVPATVQAEVDFEQAAARMSLQASLSIHPLPNLDSSKEEQRQTN